MKKLTPYITHGVLAIGILIALHYWQVENYAKLSAQSVAHQKESEFKIRTTADSLRIASQDRAYLTNANQISQYYARELNAVKRELGGKIDRMNSLVRASFLVTTSGKAKTVVIRDTTEQELPAGITDLSAMYKDGNFEIGVKMDADTAIFNPIKYTDTFSAAGFTKKKWLLGKETYYMNAWLSNKNATITGMTNFEVKEFKDKRFGIGPFVGYDVLNNRPSFGVAVQYSLFKF